MTNEEAKELSSLMRALGEIIGVLDVIRFTKDDDSRVTAGVSGYIDQLNDYVVPTINRKYIGEVEPTSGVSQ